MPFIVEWAPAAIAAYFDYIKYLDQNWPATTKRRFNMELLRRIELISHNPTLGQRVQDQPVRKILVDKYMILYYRVLTEDRVQIVNLFHGSRNPEDLQLD